MTSATLRALIAERRQQCGPVPYEPANGPPPRIELSPESIAAARRNTRIWTPEEVGTYLLNLPVEKPTLPPKAARRAAAKAKRSAPKRGRRP